MRYDYYLGIDPGKEGALVRLSPELDSLLVVKMPASIHDTINWLQLNTTHRTMIILEKAQAMPKNGAVGMFNYGMGFGEIVGAIAVLNRPIQQVAPKTWTAMMHSGIPKSLKPKEKSLRAVRNLFPNADLLASPRSKKPHEGIVDGILLALYGMRIFQMN